MLQKLLDKCEQELNWLGMSIQCEEVMLYASGPTLRCDIALISPPVTEGSYRGLKKYAIYRHQYCSVTPL